MREFEDIAKIVDWAQSLDDRWPERREVMRHIGQQILRVPFLRPNVVELCCGAGGLAESLLRESPRIRYRGLDGSISLIDFTRERLAAFDDRVDDLHTADLNADGWLNLLPDPVHAVVSMQSLHDLGDEAEVDRVYGLAKETLTRGGMFLNADLRVPEKPGRLSAERHMALMHTHGYVGVSCTLTLGAFVCVVGFVG